MSIERAYLHLLRAYPRKWRDRRQEEVLGVLLDAANERRAAWPSAAEIMNLVGHGLAARVRTLVLSVDNRDRGMIAALALSSLVALSTTLLLVGEVWPWERSAAVPGGTPASSFKGTFGPFFTLAGPGYVMLLAAVLLGCVGLRVVARRGIQAGASAVGLASLLAPTLGYNRPAVWAVVGLIVLGFLSLTGPVRTGGMWWVATGAVTAALVVVAWSQLHYTTDPRPFFYYQRLDVEVPTGALLVLLLALIGARRVKLVQPALVLATAWLGVLGLYQYSGLQPRSALLFLTAAAVLGAAATLNAVRNSICPNPEGAVKV